MAHVGGKCRQHYFASYSLSYRPDLKCTQQARVESEGGSDSLTKLSEDVAGATLLVSAQQHLVIVFYVFVP